MALASLDTIGIVGIAPNLRRATTVFTPDDHRYPEHYILHPYGFTDFSRKRVGIPLVSLRRVNCQRSSDASPSDPARGCPTTHSCPVHSGDSYPVLPLVCTPIVIPRDLRFSSALTIYPLPFVFHQRLADGVTITHDSRRRKKSP